MEVVTSARYLSGMTNVYREPRSVKVIMYFPREDRRYEKAPWNIYIVQFQGLDVGGFYVSSTIHIAGLTSCARQIYSVYVSLSRCA